MRSFLNFINEDSFFRVSVDAAFENGETEKKAFVADAKKHALTVKFQKYKYADFEAILEGPKDNVLKFLNKKGYSKDEYTVL